MGTLAYYFSEGWTPEATYQSLIFHFMESYNLMSDIPILQH